MHPEQTYKEGSRAYDDRDFLKAAAILVPLANAGHPGAQSIVADMYRWGNGVQQSAENSLHFYKAAADQGDARASFMLALLLDPHGKSAPSAMESVTKDAVAAKHYFDIAVIQFKELAGNGDKEAMCYLGFLYHTGLSVPQDGATAIDWYTKAFDAGACSAANGLALAYYEGDIRVRDKAKARFWYMKTKEFDCRFIGISEFESPANSSEKMTGEKWVIPGYEIFVRREAGIISLAEWQQAVEAIEDVRLSTGNVAIANPKTREVINIPDSPGDAEIFLADQDKWISFFRWCPATGDVAIALTREFRDPSGVLRTIARQLALRLGAQLIGTGGEVYD